MNKTTKTSTKQSTEEQYASGEACPNCPAKYKDIETNGCRGRDLAYHCTSCHHQWDAEDYRPNAEE